MKTSTKQKKTGVAAKKAAPTRGKTSAAVRAKTAAKRAKSAGSSTARKAKAARPRAKARPGAPAGHPPIYYRLHALLHTVQTISRFEDQLAGLLHEAGHAEALDDAAREELHTLLLDMPSSSYHAELDALHEALHTLREHGLEASPRRRAQGLRR